MGQQQLVLIVLGLIVISIAIVLGISMFYDNASSSSRDGVVNDLSNFAARAHVFYRKSRALGGGGSSFTGITPDDLSNKLTGSTIVTASGTYTISAVSATEITINGKGMDAGYNGTNPVEANMLVRSGTLTDSVVVVN
jgi:hypothetical protein